VAIRVAKRRAEVADKIRKSFEEVFRLDDGRIFAECFRSLKKLPICLKN